MYDLKKIEKLILILFIIIIVITIFMLILLNKRKKQEIYDNNLIIDDSPEILLDENENGFVKIDDYSMFFTILNIFNNYIDVLTYNINEDDSVEENPYWIKSNEDKQKILFSMLDEEYKEKNNINISSDINIKEYDDIYSIIPIEAKVKYGENVQIYVLSFYLENVDKKILNKEIYLVKIDSKNSTFSIMPVENCEQIDDVKVNNNVQKIDDNTYNKFYIENMTNESIVKAYFQKYKYIISNYTDVFYDQYLEKEYREARYGNKEELKKYIKDNLEEISIQKVVKYTINNYENYREYIIIDQYDNTYVFKEEAPMKFTIKFDNYTIATDNFKKTYNTATDEKKVQMNIDKFIQMINRHDYRTSYNGIADSFKNNYFKTQEEFQNYIENNFYSYNKFEFKNITKKGSNLYTCDLNITDLTNENNEIKSLTIIMQLNENLDFKMSFGM